MVLLFLASCKRSGTASLNEEGPYSRVIVTTTVHTALFRELGAGDAIVDTCEIDDGNPDIERIISHNPDAIFLSPYEGQNFEKIRKLGIPIVEMPDYLEPTPLGRAAWMKYYGKLLGKEREADSLYAAVESAYNALRDSVRQHLEGSKAPKPRVFTEMKISSTWYVLQDILTLPHSLPMRVATMCSRILKARAPSLSTPRWCSTRRRMLTYGCLNMVRRATRHLPSWLPTGPTTGIFAHFNKAWYSDVTSPKHVILKRRPFIQSCCCVTS